MKYGYIRVSTEGQDYTRQEFALSVFDIPAENIYEEKISGTKKSTSRPEFEKLFSQLKDGDELYIESMSRLARSVQDLIETTNKLIDKNICVHFLKENLHLNGAGDAVSKMIFNIMASVAQFERDLTSDRTKQALAAKKAQGVKLGAPKKISEDIELKVMAEHAKGASQRAIKDMFGIGLATVNSIIKKNTAVEA